MVTICATLSTWCGVFILFSAGPLFPKMLTEAKRGPGGRRVEAMYKESSSYFHVLSGLMLGGGAQTQAQLELIQSPHTYSCPCPLYTLPIY